MTAPRAELVSLLAAARLAPWDDMPRQVVADWLEEHGGPADLARATFIRSQLKRAAKLKFGKRTVLYEAAGGLRSPRIAPGGARVAFFEHPLRDGDRGSVLMVDRAGNKTVVLENLDEAPGTLWPCPDTECGQAMRAEPSLVPVSLGALY